MPTTTTVKQILNALKTPASTGAEVSVQQVKGVLDKQLQEAGKALKAVLLGMMQTGHDTDITGSNSDAAQATKIKLDTDGLTINLPDFADDIDKGRKPGTFPPYKAILAWVLKYRIQSLGGAGRQKLGANQLAFAIQRAIYKRGIKPRPFHDDAEAFANDLMEQLIDTVILPNLVQPLESTFNDK